MADQPLTKSIQGNPARGLLGATLGFFIGFAAVALFGTTAAKVRDALHLTPVALGFLVAMPSLSGSLLRIPFAAWVDTVGGRKPFLVLLSMSILGMAGLTAMIFLLYPGGLTPAHAPWIFLLGLLSGCGIATFSVGTGQVSYWFPKAQQGSALGTYAGIGNLAPGIFSFILPVALVWWGMAGSYLAWLIFLVAGTVLYYFLGRNAPYFQLLAQRLTPEKAIAAAKSYGEEMFPSGKILESLKLSAKTWKTWLLVVIYFTTFGGFMALTAWLPTYWKSYLNVAAVTAGSLTGLYSILTSLVRVAGGRISDRLGGERTMLISLAITVIGATMLSISGSIGLSMAAVVILALGMGVSNAAVFKLVPQEVPQAVGGASGWVGGLGAFGGFTLPPLLGTIVASQGQGGYASGFLLMVLLAVISLGLAIMLARIHGTEQKFNESMPGKLMEKQNAKH
ncbi:MAG TPA: MFS transporter [Anaerolineaceae bacterium]|nr:MFS transporter [Anaerolineaceae bacterium]